jgi:hypothetical protein
MGGNTYLPGDLVFYCNSYFHNQFWGAHCFHNLMSNHSDVPLLVLRLMTLLYLYFAFCFCCRLSPHQQYVNIGLKKYRCRGNYIPLAVSRGESIFYIFNNSPSYWLDTYCKCWLLRIFVVFASWMTQIFSEIVLKCLLIPMENYPLFCFGSTLVWYCFLPFQQSLDRDKVELFYLIILLQPFRPIVDKD